MQVCFEMKQVRFVLFAATAASLSIPALSAVERTTAKGAEPFAQCFAAAQDRAARPWSFIPREGGGGTFSNAGAAGVSQPYFVEVADRGTERAIRLTAGADRSVVRAVDHCI